MSANMLKNTGKLAGKTLFITGASRGIGKAIALKAAQDGANIVVAAKTGDPHPKLPGTIYTAGKEIEDAGGRALPCIVDVRDESNVKSAVELAVKEFGGIDILINNASAISLTGTLSTPMKTYDLMHQVNSRGTYMVSKYCLPHLLKSSNPHILNLSPPLNLRPRWFQGHCAYTMAKYGMSMCVLGMAEEFRAEGVACNAIWPRTAIITAAMEMLGGEDIDVQCRRPEIMADAAYAILSRDAKKFTGNFTIDDDILREEGINNFDVYAVDPKAKLMPDFFLDEFDDFTPEKASSAPASEQSNSDAQIGPLFETLSGVLSEELVSKIKSIYLFEVTGPTPSRWFIDLKNGGGSCGAGDPPMPADAIFKLESENLIKLFQGKLNPTQAYMTGKLDISGDLTKAIALEKLMAKMKSKL